MRNIGVIIWNMRGATWNGNDSRKAELLEELRMYWKTTLGCKENPIFMLQECGNLYDTLIKRNWDREYQLAFSKPIAAQNNRCTTGLLIPNEFKVEGEFSAESLPSGVRCYLVADAWVYDRLIRLASIHAVASNFAAEDGRALLVDCFGEAKYAICGGDFNCAPTDMEADKQFTERLQEQKFLYNVQSVQQSTHRSPSGEGSVLDYLCVKGLGVGKKEVGFGSLKRITGAYSDHWPVLYEVEVP